MNDIIKFDNKEFGEVRVVVIDDKPWFAGKDVAKALGYNDTAKAIRVHVDAEDKGVDEMATPGGKQNVTIINESGMYSLILSSKLPSAKKFKHWVTNEVIPSIRKHGAYMTDNTLEKVINDPDFLIGLLQNLKKERTARIEAETARIEAEKQRDKLIHQGKTYTSTEIAKELDYTSATILNKKLEDMGIQYKLNGTWLLSAKYSGKGYTSVKQVLLDNGSVVYDRRWTGKGRDFIIEKLSKNNEQNT